MGDLTFTLSTIDLAVIGLYIVLMAVIAIAVAGRNQSAEDYFLAGRRSTWPIIGLSLFASNISGTTLVGLAGEAYSTGISVYNYEWLAAIILAFFAIFIMPFILRARVYTMPEYLERRYDRRMRYYFSILTLFLTIVVDTAATLFAGGLILQMIFPGIPVWTIIAGLALVAGAYTVLGGLSAVMITDAIQAVILIGGSILISIFAFNAAGGLDTVLNTVPQEKLGLIKSMDDPGVPWLGLITGAPLIGFYFWCTNQFMVQRVLSAKNEDHGRWGALFAGALKLPTLFIMVLPGTAAILLYPGLENGDLIYPTLMFDLLPAGVLGLVLAGFLAAIMSQIDSTLNSSSTIVTMDFIRTRHPEMTQKQMGQVGRVVTVVFLVLSVLWAPQIENFGSLFKYLQTILSYTVAPIVALFLVGGFWKRANSNGAIASLVAGTGCGIVLFVLIEILGIMDIHFLIMAFYLFVISAAALIIVSLMTPDTRQPEDVGTLIWTADELKADLARQEGRPFWQNHYVLTAALVAATLGLVFLFR
ncbi:sodium:solute symporter [Aquisalinus flavus]|uniref:Sodium/glucose cotransporter 2 n=1 Tax=Aquisalinus flavus TaxID=1526572 RepID=A0A8J2Y645_9PROT|nr:sodium:solute symporter [Aquisalinus flavus]MBD0427067.1 sodium/solute symporter [Aquisalinus flavus]UNE46893.1 sodium/solute symporter [Aquisalinus flavus]GGC98116.1 sodium/glucose cotransporter 2 [Aquisalinus flavus]